MQGEEVMDSKEAAGDEGIAHAMEADENKMKERKVSWGKLRRVDSLSLEAGRVSNPAGHTSKVMQLMPSIN